MSLPPWIRRLVLRAVSPRDEDEVLGDLEEVYARRSARSGPIRATVVTGVEALGIAGGITVGRLRRAVRGSLMTSSELRLAARLVGRTPLMSLASVAALAVAIGLATTGFTVVAAVLDRELPLPAGDRLVDVTFRDASTGEDRPAPPPATRLGGDAVPGLDHVGLARTAQRNVRHPTGEVELVSEIFITPGSLERLGVPPIVGRGLSAQDALPGAEPVVLLGEAWWAARFNRDPSVVGRILDLGTRSARVVGVLPQEAVYPGPADLWSPLDATPEAAGAARAGTRLFGTLAPGATPALVAASLGALADGWWDAGLVARPVTVSVQRTEDPGPATLPGVVVLSVLIALLVLVAGNVANLIMARTAARRGELAVRTALGAGRGRLVAQISIEVLLMALAAAGVGLWASQRVLAMLAASEAEDLPPWIDLGLDAGVVAFVMGVTLLATLVAGVVPALRATRSQLGGLLRSGGGGPGASSFGRLEDTMIVGQVALSIGILGAALLVHQGWSTEFLDARLGVPSDRILVARMSADAPLSGATLRGLEARLTQLPGVVAAGVGDHTPGVDAPLRQVVLEDEAGGPGTALRVPRARVGPGYFQALGTGPLTGRTFVADDFAADALPVALVNRSFVDRYLGGGNAVGRHIAIPDARPPDAAPALATPSHRIVGVVPDLGLTATDPERAAGVYLPLTTAWSFRAVVQTATQPEGLDEAVRGAAFAVDPGIGVNSTIVLSTSLSALRRVFVVAGWGFTGFGGLVLGLSLLATYALLAFEVTRRTREIGVRVALGARPARILTALLSRVAGYVAVGALVGTGLGYLLVEVARATFVHRFPPTSPWTFLGLAGLALLVGFAAAWIPARRALSVHPVEALRAD